MECFGTSIVFVFLILGAAAFPELHTFKSQYGGETIAYEDVVFDQEEQYALITINPTSDMTLSTTNLHDFNTSYTAIRDAKRGRCTIFKTRHTLNEMMNLYKSMTEGGFFDITQTFICTSSETVPNSETSRFGKRIAEFCRDTDVVFSDRKFLRKRRRSIRSMSMSAMNCGFCIGACNTTPSEPSGDRN